MCDYGKATVPIRGERGDRCVVIHCAGNCSPPERSPHDAFVMRPAYQHRMAMNHLERDRRRLAVQYVVGTQTELDRLSTMVM